MERQTPVTGGAALWPLVALLFAAEVAHANEWVYVVSDKDTLWDISEKYLQHATDWKKVQRINRLDDPDRIDPGTRIRIPLKWIRTNGVPVTVNAVEGEAFIYSVDGTRTQVVPGNLVNLGDRIETRPDASVSVAFADGTLMLVHGGSSTVFDHLSAYGETGMVDSRMRLLQGRVETRVTPASGPGSRFEIHTASAISAVRGTAYRMAVLEDGDASTIEVTEGTVAAATPKATSRKRVNQGYGTFVELGQPPREPRKLLAPPRLVDLPDKLDRLGWPVEWAPVAGATRYRAELATHEAFETLIWERIISSPRIRLPELPDGTFHLRVRAIDDLGIEGIDATTALLQDARPEPPSPLQPGDGSVTREAAPALSWSKSLEASTYRLQISTDESFSTLVADLGDLEALVHTESATARPGTYHWRLASIAPDGEQGPFGASRSYEVKPVPASPEPTISSDDTQLTVSWRPGIADERYRVQLANDPDFTALLLDDVLDEPNLTIEQVKGQMRYFRMRVVEADGYEGPWAGIQQIPPLPDPTWWRLIFGAAFIALLL